MRLRAGGRMSVLPAFFACLFGSVYGCFAYSFYRGVFDGPWLPLVLAGVCASAVARVSYYALVLSL